MSTATISEPPAVALAARSRRRPARNRSVARNLWWFVLPAMAFYLFVVVAPTLQGVQLSFTDWSAFSPERPFIGLENYTQALGGASGDAIMRTLLIAVVVMAVQNVGGLLLALALNTAVVGRNVLRTLIFAPAVVSPLVCGYLFQYIFGPPGIGAANAALEAIGLPQRDWLGNPGTALMVVILVTCWQTTGVAMVIYLAGLQGVPVELIEASSIDGAGPAKRFWYIVRPLLAPAFMINLMLTLIGGLKIFDVIFATTNGGPAGTTETISTLIYKNFSLLGEYGVSSALAVLLAIVVAILSIIQLTVLRRQGRNA